MYFKVTFKVHIIINLIPLYDMAQIQSGREQIAATRQDLNAKKESCNQGLAQIEQQEAQLSEGEAQLEGARSQLAALQAQYEHCLLYTSMKRLISLQMTEADIRFISQ